MPKVPTTAGFIEEVSFNITAASKTNAAMITDNALTPTINSSAMEKSSIVAASFVTSPNV